MEEALGAIETAIFGVGDLLAVFALVLLLVELLWLWRRRRLGKERWLEMLASYSTLVPSIAAELLLAASWLAVYLGVQALVPWQIPTTLWSAVLAVILVDLAYYWEHRLSHEIRLLWALAHSVHHSSPHFNQATAYRISFVDQFISPVFYLPIVTLGFNPLLVLAAFVLILSYQTWLHTEMIGRLGWLDRVFNTPSNHRVHHGADAGCLDRNYGAVLMIWDRIFGTYRAEAETPVYGLTRPLNSKNPFKVHFYEAGILFRDLRAAESLVEALGLLFRRPGWRPPQRRAESRATTR
ncbi:MAG: sterol desaturase family protein [Kiloniellales bacterium]|nr:sterol desaturase family protein [Kiloniellales bacterium]